MRVLNISLEKKLFTADSPVRQRVAGYARLFERFDLMVLTLGGYRWVEQGNTAIFPTNSVSRLFYIFDAYCLGKKMISQYQPQVVSAQDPFETGLISWLLARRCGLKFQIQVHGDFFGSFYWRAEKLSNRLRYCLGKFIVRRADGLRVVSRRVKDSLMKLGVPAEKIMVVPIYASVNSKQLTVNSSRNPDKFVFLTVGRLVPVKNIGLQIEVMVEVVKKYPQAELWIVGDGPEYKNLKFKIENLKLSSNIKLLGWQEELGTFYEQADVFLLTSNYEGWGLAVIEAASFALPIVMTDVGCAGQIIKSGESGLVVPVGDKQALISAMTKLIQDKELRNKLGQAAAQTILSLPNQEQSRQLYKESLEKTLVQS